MKSLINSVRLMGNVGATPQVKSFDNGNKMAKVRLATNENQKNAKGESVKVTHWHNLVFWGRQAELIEKYIGKGERIAVEGSLTNRSYESKTGEKKQITEVRVDEIQFISNRRPITALPAETIAPVKAKAPARKKKVVEDDLPF
jgi:single-strand DNA-binding protein